MREQTAYDRRQVVVGQFAVALSACAALSLSEGMIVHAAASGAVSQRPVLASPEQVAGEKLALELIQDTRVQAVFTEVRASLLKGWLETSPDAAARIDHALRMYTASLVIQENAAAPGRTAFAWAPDNGAHSWEGYAFPGSGVSGDNPDQIYRSLQLEGTAQYEILGQIEPGQHASQISISIVRSREVGLPPRQEPGRVFLGNQYATISLDQLKPSADGHFRMLVGGLPDGNGGLHVPLEAGQFRMLVREMLADWQQRPMRLTVRRLTPGAGGPPSAEQIRQRSLEHLRDYLEYWGSYQSRFLGGLAPNSAAGPFAREGGWGTLAGIRFQLAPDEVAIVTIDPGSAPYTGLHVNDPWMITPAPHRIQTSLNTSQSVAAGDGSLTYVVAPDDPGLANWLDTDGMHEGYVLIRWVGPGNEDGKLRDFRVIKRTALSGDEFAGLARVSPQDRSIRLDRRARDYATRFA